MKRSPLVRVSKKRGRQRSLRKRLWPTFSRLIRQRDKRCLMAGQEFGACGGPLHCSHIYPKGKYPLLELFPLNAKALCAVHHLYHWHRNPLECAAWLRRALPKDWIVRLIAEKNTSLTRKGMTEEQIRAEWKMFGLLP